MADLAPDQRITRPVRGASVPGVLPAEAYSASDVMEMSAAAQTPREADVPERVPVWPELAMISSALVNDRPVSSVSVTSVMPGGDVNVVADLTAATYSSASRFLRRLTVRPASLKMRCCCYRRGH